MYSSFRLLFHYPYITPIYYIVASIFVKPAPPAPPSLPPYPAMPLPTSLHPYIASAARPRLQPPYPIAPPRAPHLARDPSLFGSLTPRLGPLPAPFPLCRRGPPLYSPRAATAGGATAADLSCPCIIGHPFPQRPLPNPSKTTPKFTRAPKASPRGTEVFLKDFSGPPQAPDNLNHEHGPV